MEVGRLNQEFYSQEFHSVEGFSLTVSLVIQIHDFDDSILHRGGRAMVATRPSPCIVKAIFLRRPFRGRSIDGSSLEMVTVEPGCFWTD